VLQHDNDDVGDLPLSGRVLGDLSLNDIVEIRIRVSERLPDGELPTTLALLNSSGDIFELVLFGDKELEIYTAGCAGSAECAVDQIYSRAARVIPTLSP
jgi:hypothetical protein